MLVLVWGIGLGELLQGLRLARIWIRVGGEGWSVRTVRLAFVHGYEGLYQHCD